MSCGANSDAQSLACPRCNSHDTKFCYYNNYSTAQPRHFCKNCKRYWTAGGSLRNVPVGGGLRKSKKSKLSKHGKDLLSASPDEFLHPGKLAISLPLASPSSSTDGLVDDSFAAPVGQPLLAYRPSFDFTADNDFSGEIRTIPASPIYSLHHINLAPNSEHHGSGLSANGHYQLVHDKRSGLRYPQNCYGGMDGEPRIHEEMSQSRISQGVILSDMNKGFSSMERPQNYDRNEINIHPGVRQFVEEAKTPAKQSTMLCPAHDLRTISRHEPGMNSFLTEGEDEAVGNVVNVRYPYDWEQVSEVLCGGTPDFFQLPTF